MEKSREREKQTKLWLSSCLNGFQLGLLKLFHGLRPNDKLVNGDVFMVRLFYHFPKDFPFRRLLHTTDATFHFESFFISCKRNAGSSARKSLILHSDSFGAKQEEVCRVVPSFFPSPCSYMAEILPSDKRYETMNESSLVVLLCLPAWWKRVEWRWHFQDSLSIPQFIDC